MKKLVRILIKTLAAKDLDWAILNDLDENQNSSFVHSFFVNSVVATVKNGKLRPLQFELKLQLFIWWP